MNFVLKIKGFLKKVFASNLSRILWFLFLKTSSLRKNKKKRWSAYGICFRFLEEFWHGRDRALKIGTHNKPNHRELIKSDQHITEESTTFWQRTLHLV